MGVPVTETVLGAVVCGGIADGAVPGLEAPSQLVWVARTEGDFDQTAQRYHCTKSSVLSVAGTSFAGMGS